MASKSRARGGADPYPDERGAGGKMLRSRHSAAASPYQRPAAAASSLAVLDEADERRGWLSGLVSGAGRLISAVFRSDSGNSSCSCSDSDYSGDSDGVSEGASQSDDEKKDQPGTNLELVEDRAVDCQPLASMSRSKRLIEQLLEQETYTRDECNRLMKIIQSRVVDSPATESGRSGLPLEFPSRTPSGNTASTRVLGLNTELLGRSPTSGSYLNTIYSSPYIERAYAPDFCDKAVLEAKKWVEDKRSAVSPKVNCGPCMLNTDMHCYGSDSDKGSPVDLAVSYMESLPPWQSPIARTAGFRSPTIAARLEKYESPFSPALSSLRATKRSFRAVGSWDTSDASRSVRQKTSEDIPLSPEFRQPDTSNRVLDYEYIQTSSVTDKRDPEALGGENVHDLNPPRNNGFCKETGNSDHEHAVNASEQTLNVYIRCGNSTGNLDSGSGLQVESLESRHGILVAEKNQVKDLDESPVFKELGSIAPHQTALDSSMKNNDLVEDFMHAEPIAMVPENNNPAISSSTGEGVDATDHGASSRQRSSELEKLRRGNNYSQPDSFSVPEEAKEAPDQSTTSLNVDHNLTTTSNGAVGNSNVPVKSSKPSSSASADATGVHVSSTVVNKAHAGTSKKAIKETLREHPPTPGRGRGKKTAARPRRSRGSGR